MSDRKDGGPAFRDGPYGYSNTIQKAASLALGRRLGGLREICETQKSISTAKLSAHLDKIQEGMTLDAIHFRKLADALLSERDGGGV